MSAHGAVYGSAALYDLAFGGRDFARECGFLWDLFEARRGRQATSFLELAAGPARHALELRAAGKRVTALDISHDMAEHAERLASERGLDIDYRLGDMAEFELDERYDLVANMTCSATYLLTDEAFIAHLRCVRNVLVDDGMYVLELPHPSELETPKSRSRWTVRDARGVLEAEWAPDGQKRAPNIWTARVRLAYRPFDGSAPTIVTDTAEQRDFTAEDIERFARRAGFIVEARFGALDENVALEHASAWRMVVALRKDSMA